MGPSVPGSISYSSVVFWADAHEMSYYERQILDVCMLAMDEVYRGWYMAKNAPASP